MISRDHSFVSAHPFTMLPLLSLFHVRSNGTEEGDGWQIADHGWPAMPVGIKKRGQRVRHNFFIQRVVLVAC